MTTMPRSPTSGKDIDAIARRLSETDFTSPAATWALLSSDYPQLGSNRLAALREALEVAINTSSDTAKTDFPLTPRVLQGLAYGAGSALSTGDGGDVPGLVDAPAAPSQYAAVYALCVQRATALLYLSDPMLRDELHDDDRPPPPPDEPPPADAPPAADDAAADAVAAEEVWAAEPDGDDAYDDYASAAPPYEAPPLGTAAAAVAAAKPLAVAEAFERLKHLVASLSHEPLVALAPGAWARLGLGDTLRRALAHAGGGREARGQPPVPDGSLARLLRDRFVFDPTICAAELGPTLAEMPTYRRPLFLASLVGGGGSGGATVSAAAAAAGCWEAIDAAIRAEVPSLFETLSQARGPPEAGSAAADALRVALMVLEWYVADPPPPAARRREVPRGLLGCGATQAMLQLVLAGDDGAAAAAVLLGGVWRWLLGACSRYAEILAWVQQVPRLPDAIRASSHLRERKAQAVCWLLLLASAPANSASSSAPKAAAAAAARAAELRAEALVAVQACVRDESTEGLRHTLELISLLGGGSGGGGGGGAPVIIPGGEAGASVVQELEGLHRRLRAALAAEEAAENATAPAAAPPPPPVQVGGGSGPGGFAADVKRKEMLGRAVAALQQLLHRVRAPGKAD